MDVLLTGASGYLGAIILKRLSDDGFNIFTIGRNKNSSLQHDLVLPLPELNLNIDLVIHCAGKAHSIPKTPMEKLEFYETNVIGTKNLLAALIPHKQTLKNFIYISSVAVYGLDHGTLIAETDPLNASDAYGRSKIEAEIAVKNWCKVNDVKCTILRLPLVVAEDPPGNLGAMILGIKRGFYFNIGDGQAKKSMILAEDVANFILRVAPIGGVYNLNDGYHPTFKELGDLIALQTHKRRPIHLPFWLCKLVAKIGDFLGAGFPLNSRKLDKITNSLTFSNCKAVKELNWTPKPVLKYFKIQKNSLS